MTKTHKRAAERAAESEVSEQSDKELGVGLFVNNC